MSAAPPCTPRLFAIWLKSEAGPKRRAHSSFTAKREIVRIAFAVRKQQPRKGEGEPHHRARLLIFTIHHSCYVDVLGPWLTIRFLLTFGGAELYLPTKPGTHARLVALVGLDKAWHLAASAHLLQRRVPLAKRWLARCLKTQGQSSAHIARTLRVSDTSLRKWLKD